MGNLTSEPQFRDKLQEFLDIKQNKKTLKIRYKESKQKATILESVIIKQPHNQEIDDQDINQIHTIEQVISLKKRRQQSIFKNIQVEVIGRIFFNTKEPKRIYIACSKCKKKLVRNRSLSKCIRCADYSGSETNYSIPVTISDNTGSAEVIIFGAAEQYIGIPAKQFALLNTSEQNSLFEKINRENQQKQFKIGLSVNLEQAADEKLPYILSIQQQF